MQGVLGLQNQEMARELRISPEWYSKVVNGKRPASIDLVLRLDDLVRRRGIEQRLSQFKRERARDIGAEDLNLGPKLESHDASDRAVSEGVASRIPQKREPSTRADCERYFQHLMDAADLSDDPNAWPVILHRLKHEFPLEEWRPAEPDKP